MREAIGGTLLMQIVLIFLIVYIMFMAVVINYGRVFRAKNNLITYIETEEGFKEGMTRKVREKATDLGYTGDIHVCYTEGNDTKYFSIMLFINFELPLVTSSVQIPINGETSGIRNVSDNVESIKKCHENGKGIRDESYKITVGG
jgi:hypothetical protein